MFNFKELASYAYRQYELVTCINMLEPWERKLISEYRHKTYICIIVSLMQSLFCLDGFFLIMMTLVIFSSCVYLPNYLQNLMQFVTPPAWLNPGENVAYVAQKMARS
ncbi:hypothetical protein KR074_010892 [Drosophila pseudoananassae]|nr:hypothetical protein KR074_010892 [Drosophila pseudoananassae]